MNCKYYKIRKKNNKKEKRIYFYCDYKREEITYCDCRNCAYKEYKEFSNQINKAFIYQEKTKNSTKKGISNQIKKRTYKLAKAEKNRYSIIFSDLSKCCVCNSKENIELNEVYEGSYRQLSIKHGMITPFCQRCHNRFHNDRLMNLYYKSLFQKEFEKAHSRTEFLKIFKKNYIYLFEKEKLKGG